MTRQYPTERAMLRLLTGAIIAALVVLLAIHTALGGGLFYYCSGRSSGSIPETIAALQHRQADIDAVTEFWSRVKEKRVEGALRLVESPIGEYWLPKSCGPLCLMAEQEHDEYGHVRRGDIVLDCGANVGTFTRQAVAAGAATVVAIEPAPENLECLRRNLREEIQSGTVVVVSKGVWDRETNLQLTTDNRNSAEDSVVLKPETPGDTVGIPVTTIDKLVQELALPRVDFVKMDIEGAEKQALSGGRETIARFKPRLGIATEHLPDDETAIPALVRSIRSDYGTYPVGAKRILPATGRVGTQVVQFR